MKVDLNITGTVESLHLEPGDRVVVTLDKHNLRAENISQLHEQLKVQFPDNEIVILCGLRIARETATCA